MSEEDEHSSDWKLLGIDGEGRGSGVEVVEWSRKWGRGGNGAGGKNGQGATVKAGKPQSPDEIINQEISPDLKHG
nr:hypothetical protein [Tanacetum cinerariifolium]